MKLYYKFSVVDDYLIIEFNGKKVDVFPKEDVFLDTDRLLKFKEVHIRYHSDEVVKFTEKFDNCALTEDTPVSVDTFLNYFISQKVGVASGSGADYTEVLNNILSAVDGLEITTENIKVEAGEINLNTDQLEEKLDTLITNTESTKTSFQQVDCAGTNIGTPVDVQKVVVLNKPLSSICNTADISDPVVAAIEAQTTTYTAGKKQDFISWSSITNDTMTIPTGQFSTIAMLAVKGEFKIENTANNFASLVTVSSGTVSNFIEISEEGTGTATGATSAPQGFDTRSNAYDLDPLNNSFLITCVIPGILQVELYK